MTDERDYTQPPAHADGTPDGRYSIALEWCGAPRQRYVVRFCGEWIGTSDARGPALAIAHTFDREHGPTSRSVTVDTLSARMEFDHTIRVWPGGLVTDAIDSRPTWAPSLLDDELDSDSWSLLTGYSGQHGYSGPVMHPSEFIAGAMARDILARPGLYVAIVANYTPEDYDESTGELDAAGWAVAYRATDGEATS